MMQKSRSVWLRLFNSPTASVINNKTLCVSGSQTQRAPLCGRLHKENCKISHDALLLLLCGSEGELSVLDSVIRAEEGEAAEHGYVHDTLTAETTSTSYSVSWGPPAARRFAARLRPSWSYFNHSGSLIQSASFSHWRFVMDVKLSCC